MGVCLTTEGANWRQFRRYLEIFTILRIIIRHYFELFMRILYANKKNAIASILAHSLQHMTLGWTL